MSLTSFIVEYNKRKYVNKYSGNLSNLLFYGSIVNMIRSEQNRDRKRQQEKQKSAYIR